MDKVPNWLRWLLFLPASLLALIVVYPVIQIANYFFSPEGDLFLVRVFSIVVGAGWTGFAFVWVATKVVPNRQFVVSIIMTAIYAMLSGFVLTAKLLLGQSSDTGWFEILASVVIGTAGAIIACYQTYEENTKQVNEQSDHSEYWSGSLVGEIEEDSSEDEVSEEEDFPWEIISLTPLVSKCEHNQLTKYVDQYYQKMGSNSLEALLQAKSVWLWFIRNSILNDLEIPNSKHRLLEEFDLMLHRKTQSWQTYDVKFSLFEAFEKLDAEISKKEINLKSIPGDKLGTKRLAAEVLSLIHESLGEVSIDIDKETMRIPIQVFEETRAQVKSVPVS